MDNGKEPGGAAGGDGEGWKAILRKRKKKNLRLGWKAILRKRRRKIETRVEGNVEEKKKKNYQYPSGRQC